MTICLWKFQKELLPVLLRGRQWPSTAPKGGTCKGKNTIRNIKKVSFISYVLHNIWYDSLTSLMYNITLDRTLWGLRSGLYTVIQIYYAENITILYSVLNSLNDFNSHRPAADLLCMIQSLHFWTIDLYGTHKVHLNKREENEHFLLLDLNLIFNSKQLNMTINEALIIENCKSW